MQAQPTAPQYPEHEKLRTVAEVSQEIESCGRLLVGQGSDTYDPECVLSAGHNGGCKPVVFEVVKMINGTWNVRDNRTEKWVDGGVWLSKPAATELAAHRNDSLAPRDSEAPEFTESLREPPHDARPQTEGTV